MDYPRSLFVHFTFQQQDVVRDSSVFTQDIIMVSFNVLFFTCDRSVCVRKDGDFLLLDNPGEVVCKWLVENIDETGRPITEERDFKAMILFQSSVKKQCLMMQSIFQDLIASYSGTREGLKQTDMQQLVKDPNDPSRFRDVLVPKRKLHKLLEEAKAARDSAGFLLNGISEILFSPKELASAKGVTKARAGTAVLDEEKVDALFEFMKSVCSTNGWPSLDNRSMRRKLATKICNARRGLKKTPNLELNNKVDDFR